VARPASVAVFADVAIPARVAVPAVPALSATRARGTRRSRDSRISVPVSAFFRTSFARIVRFLMSLLRTCDAAYPVPPSATNSASVATTFA
jgi:hypothetical protein